MKKFFASAAILLCAGSANAEVITSGQWNRMVPPTENGPQYFANDSFEPYANNPTTYDQGWEYLSALGDSTKPVSFKLPGMANATWTMGATAWTNGVGSYDEVTGLVSYDARIAGQVSNSVDGFIQYFVARFVTATRTYYRVRVEDIVASVLSRERSECSDKHEFCGDFTDNELTLDEITQFTERPPTIPEPTIFAMLIVAGLVRRYAWR